MDCDMEHKHDPCEECDVCLASESCDDECRCEDCREAAFERSHPDG